MTDNFELAWINEVFGKFNNIVHASTLSQLAAIQQWGVTPIRTTATVVKVHSMVKKDFKQMRIGQMGGYYPDLQYHKTASLTWKSSACYHSQQCMVVNCFSTKHVLLLLASFPGG